MIPKKIHYIWFGQKEKPKHIKKCIESFKILGYEIYEWNEHNYDVNKSIFLKETYKNKIWGFLSDYVRFDVLYNIGGIYIDADVMVKKKIPDELLDTDVLMGFQFDCLIGTHFIGAKKNSAFIKYFLDRYHNYKLGENLIVSNTIFNDFYLKNIKDFKLNGKNQVLDFKGDKISLYNKNYFDCPKIIGNGYAYHLLDNSWRKKKYRKIKDLFKLIFGDKVYYNLLAYKALKISPYYEKYKKAIKDEL